MEARYRRGCYVLSRSLSLIELDVPRSASQVLSIRRQRRRMVARCSVFDVDDRGGSATGLPAAGVVQCPALRDPVWHRLARHAERTSALGGSVSAVAALAGGGVFR